MSQKRMKSLKTKMSFHEMNVKIADDEANNK